ncbi:hypothetical protein NC653_004656 [Populus alba x Populus x berolinensis]|uniref:Uncharacterized protein n=1 Tax=Populus alba x Populus x berolinensis TaxID=444605 RepID=A0AAD6RUI8_9ROSI|nr:hypothetical protein NC653_004656 [Populus alba x Populus x berolinensis]
MECRKTTPLGTLRGQIATATVSRVLLW